VARYSERIAYDRALRLGDVLAAHAGQRPVDLQVRVDAGGEPAEDLHHVPVAEDHRRVGLLADQHPPGQPGLEGRLRREADAVHLGALGGQVEQPAGQLGVVQRVVGEVLAADRAEHHVVQPFRHLLAQPDQHLVPVPATASGRHLDDEVPARGVVRAERRGFDHLDRLDRPPLPGEPALLGEPRGQ
jgi:hypothetical protein